MVKAVYTPRQYESLEDGCRRLYREEPLKVLAQGSRGSYILLARDNTDPLRILVSIGYAIGGPFIGITPEEAEAAFRRLAYSTPDRRTYMTTRFPVQLGPLQEMVRYIRAQQRALPALPKRSVAGRSSLTIDNTLERAGIKPSSSGAHDGSRNQQPAPWERVVEVLTAQYSRKRRQ